MKREISDVLLVRSVERECKPILRVLKRKEQPLYKKAKSGETSADDWLLETQPVSRPGIDGKGEREKGEEI